MKLDTTTSKDRLTVKVTLPKIKDGDRVLKVDSAKVLNILKDKYDIITCFEKCTISSSTEREETGTMVYKIKYKNKTRRKTSKKTAKTDETDTEEKDN